ncbi:MAG: GntR family transcriptional regulator [Planctomycetota bacterium]|nr:GntR family transcriptional regulator [Planctomycetota bacterium]
MVPPSHIHITPGDDAPIYRQIVRQVIAGVASGDLAPGERLPSLRALAKALVVAPLTVKKAYEVLESDGLIETKQGQGTFIRIDAAKSKQKASERLHSTLRRLVIEAEVAGIEPHELQTLIQQATQALQTERRTKGDRA